MLDHLKLILRLPFAPLAFIIALLAAIALAYSLAHAEPATDIPREQPTTATGFAICENGKELLVAVVFTYPSGRILRFDVEHMHGISTAQELAHYATAAADQKLYAVSCGTTET